MPRTAWTGVAVLAVCGLAVRQAGAQELRPLPVPLPPPAPAVSGGDPADAWPDVTSSPDEHGDPVNDGNPLPPPAFAPPPPLTSPAPPPPTPLRPPTSPAPPPSLVRFEPDEAGVTLLGLSGAVPFDRGSYYYEGRYAAVYGPICQGPCTARLMPGAYRLALAKGGRIVPVSGPVIVNGPVTLRGEFVDRSGLRALGLGIGVVGTIGGFVMIVASAQSQVACNFDGICVSRGTADAPLLAGGVGVLLASALVGSLLSFQRDEARLTLEPLAVPGRGGREGPPTPVGASTPQGAALALHF